MATTRDAKLDPAYTRAHTMVILASSLGTVFEWYDFFLYGSLATVISKQFFSSLNETSAFIVALLAFAAGYIVRPFGAVVFGRLGDMVGRKYTFLATIVMMGLSTALVGCLPSYATIGAAAPIILIVLRLCQGLAIGGEYGGAATYVAEHAPPGKRGRYTSWIQTTATAGLVLSLVIILACRKAFGASFDVWGWRIPFLVSLFLLGISVFIRMQLHESPVFKKMKEDGTHSKAPLTEAFLRWPNLKIVLIALFGGVAGMAVVWYTGMFYIIFFLQKTLKLEPQTATMLVVGALVLATPFFVVVGALSDKIGRKWLIVGGCLISALTFFPIFKALTKYANPAIATAEETCPVRVIADPDDCTFQFDPIGSKKFRTSCDVAKNYLATKAIPYRNEPAPRGTIASVRIGEKVIESFDGQKVADEDAFKADKGKFEKGLAEALAAGGYPEKADMSKVNSPVVLLLLFILGVYVAIVYAPIGAALVELFPTNIRYTSMSLPYHLGTGWFGGFLPTVSFAMVATTGDIYYGLWYPVIIALVTAVIGAVFLPETKDRDINV